MTTPYKETRFGFEFGAARIERACSDTKAGWVLLTLETPKHKGGQGMQIYVTKTGKVRISDKQGEWFPKEKRK